MDMNQLAPYIIGAAIALLVQWLSGGKLKLPIPPFPQPQPPQPAPTPSAPGTPSQPVTPTSPGVAAPQFEAGALVPIIVAALSAILPKLLEELMAKMQSEK